MSRGNSAPPTNSQPWSSASLRAAGVNSLLVTTIVLVQSCIGAPATTSCTALAPTGRDSRLHCTAIRFGRCPTIRSTPQSPVSGVMITGNPQVRATRATWSSNSSPDISTAASSRALGVLAPRNAPARKRGVAANTKGNRTPKARHHAMSTPAVRLVIAAAAPAVMKILIRSRPTAPNVDGPCDKSADLLPARRANLNL